MRQMALLLVSFVLATPTIAAVETRTETVEGLASTWIWTYNCRPPGDTGPEDPGSGFCENTPTPPVGTNTAATVGDQYRAVILQAIGYYADRLASNLPIRARIEIGPMGCLGQSGTLLGLFANPYFVPMRQDDPLRPLHMFGGPGIAYTVPQAVAMIGPETYAPGVIADGTFNGGPTLDEGQDIYEVTINNLAGCVGQEELAFRGLEDDAIPAGTFSVYHTTLHELGHGLGMMKSSVLDVFTLDTITGQSLFELTVAENFAARSTAVNTPDRLVWVGTNVTAAVADREITQGISGGFAKIESGSPQSLDHFSQDHGPHEWMAFYNPEFVNFADGSLTIPLLRDIRWPMFGDDPIVVPPELQFDHLQVPPVTLFGPTFGNRWGLDELVTVRAFNVLGDPMPGAPMRINCPTSTPDTAIEIGPRDPGPFNTDGTPKNINDKFYRTTDGGGFVDIDFERMVKMTPRPTEGTQYVCTLFGRGGYTTDVVFEYTEAELASRVLTRLELTNPNTGDPLGTDTVLDRTLPDDTSVDAFILSFAAYDERDRPFGLAEFEADCSGPNPDPVSEPGRTIFSGPGYLIKVQDIQECGVVPSSQAAPISYSICSVRVDYETTLPYDDRDNQPVQCQVGLATQVSPKIVFTVRPKPIPEPATITADLTEIAIEETTAAGQPFVIGLTVTDENEDPIPTIAPTVMCDHSNAIQIEVTTDTEVPPPITDTSGNATLGLRLRTLSDVRSGEVVCTVAAGPVSTVVRFTQEPAVCADGRISCIFTDGMEQL
jgi:hypothetical protein